MFATVLCFALAIVWLVLAVLQFLEKGPCLNNACLYASKEEREKMNKSPHYRQSAIVFAILCLIFAVMGFYSLVHLEWLMYLEGALFIAVIVYAIVSAIKINQREQL